MASSRWSTTSSAWSSCDGARNAVKYGNVVGVPLLLVFYGLVRWRTRELRRRRLNQQPAA